MKTLKFFGWETSVGRLIAVIVIFVGGVVLANTVGEFIVALHNRYSVYPVGMDTNMYGYSFAVAMLFCLVMAVLSVWVLSKKMDAMGITIVFGVVFFAGIPIGIEIIPSFIPETWCKYELTIYPCSDASPDFYQDPNTGEVIYKSI